jgi:hypothetical protein
MHDRQKNTLVPLSHAKSVLANLSNSVHRPMSSDLIFGGTQNSKLQIKLQILKIILNQIKSPKSDFK